MVLLTKAIRKTMPKLYSTEKLEDDKKTIHVKFFDPSSQWTWYAIEGEPVFDDNNNEVDFHFFGYVIGHEKEFGYFSLNELKSVKNRFGLGIERDKYLGKCTLKDVMSGKKR